MYAEALILFSSFPPLCVRNSVHFVRTLNFQQKPLIKDRGLLLYYEPMRKL